MAGRQFMQYDEMHVCFQIHKFIMLEILKWGSTCGSVCATNNPLYIILNRKQMPMNKKQPCLYYLQCFTYQFLVYNMHIFKHINWLQASSSVWGTYVNK